MRTKSARLRARLLLALVGLVGLLVLTGPATGSTLRSQPTPPINTSVPKISGTPTVGSKLKTSNGTWSGGPTGYKYQWRTCDAAGGNCSDLAGSTSSAYLVKSADVGKTVRVEVDAKNGAGTGTAVSAPTGVVPGTPAPAPTPPPPPTATAPPAPCTITVSTTAQLLDVNHTVNPGDVVCISGTLTTSSNIFLGRSGTRTAPIVYRGGKIQYTGGSASGGLLQVNGGTPWAGAHDIVFDGMTLDGASLIGAGITVSRGAHHVTVQNCVIQNTGSSGISFSAVDYVTAVDNRIYRAGYNQGWGSGISLWYGGNGGNTYGGTTAWYGDAKTDLGFHNVIARNIVSGSFDAVHHSDGNGFIVDGSGDIPPALFVGNVAFENGGRGFENLGNTGSVWFVNNTSYMNGLDLAVGSGQAPEMMASSATGTRWVNNVAYGRKNSNGYATAYLCMIYLSTVSWARQLAYNGQNSGVSSLVTADAAQYLYADPRFRDRPIIGSLDPTPWASALPPWSLGDRLAAADGSPAIDAGVDPLSASGLNSSMLATLRPYLDVDLLGNPRVAGARIDVGAFER